MPYIVVAIVLDCLHEKIGHMPYLVAIVDCTHADHTQITVPIDTSRHRMLIFLGHTVILLMVLFYSSFS